MMLLSMSTRLKNAELYAKMGYDAIDVDLSGVILEGEKHYPELDGEDWLLNVENQRKSCEQMGLLINSIHMPYKYQVDDENFPKIYEMLCRALVAAERYGAKWAVMHCSPKEQMLELVRKLFADTKVKNVGIAIENSSNRMIDELVEIHDILKEEGYPMCICLDLGHCHRNHRVDIDVAEKIYEMGDRIQMLHIHDNFRNDDTHAVPFWGSIPWERVMKALKDVGYQGVFNYEIAMQWTPEPLKEPFVQYHMTVAKYLMEIFDSHIPKKG